MIDRIKASLAKLSIDEYIINRTEIRSSQLFFIKKKLDMKRIENTESIAVTVFRIFEKNDKTYKGSSMAHIYNGMTDEEIEKALSTAYLSASYVCNPSYNLQEKTDNKIVTMESDLNDKTLEECSKQKTIRDSVL